jgi:hypothetical protein
VTVETDLITAAARIARSSPDAWDRFVAAVQAYSSQQITHCIQSPLDLLPVAQGRAQATARLYGILAECIASADKLEGKRK